MQITPREQRHRATSHSRLNVKHVRKKFNCTSGAAHQFMKMHMHPRLAIARARRDGLAEVQTLGRPLNRFGRRAYILLAVLRWRMRSRSTPCLHLALCATPLILRTAVRCAVPFGCHLVFFFENVHQNN